MITILLTILIAAAAGAAAGAGVCLLAVNVLTGLHADMSIMKPLILWGILVGLICAGFRIWLLMRRKRKANAFLDTQSSHDWVNRRGIVSEMASSAKTMISQNSRAIGNSLFPAKLLDGATGMTPAAAHADRIHKLLADNACEISRMELFCNALREAGVNEGGADE